MQVYLYYHVVEANSSYMFNALEASTIGRENLGPDNFSFSSVHLAPNDRSLQYFK